VLARGHVVISEEGGDTYFGDEVELTDDLRHALDGAAGVLLVTKWDQFRAVPDLVRGMQPPPVVVDGRRMLPRDSVPRYEGIGL
jgi:UDPglucose 6-dehydrogenase/GDP-mannose 6-dehydrogenase